MRTILVPTDFSAGTESTLAHACELAEQLHAGIHLLHVLPTHDLPAIMGGEPEERIHTARQQLERLSQHAVLSRLNVVCATRIGRPALEIVRYAREQGVGLIAMGTHGRTGLAHLVMGSVAEQVVRDGPCPVLVMRPDSFSDRRAGLADAAQRLFSSLGPEVVGDRHESWEVMRRLLTTTLDLEATEAARLLGVLEATGAVLWHEPTGQPDGSAPARRYWAIDPDVLGIPSEVKRGRSPESEGGAASSPALDLLQRALANRATDVHIDPLFDDQFEVRFRIDGKIEPYCRLDRGVAAPLIQQFKVMAGFDIAEPFRPKEGRLDLPAGLSGLEVRVTAAPVQGGTAMALRLLSHDRALRPLETLGLNQEARQAIERMLRSGAGLVLVTGPTGSGKTTTIYSLLKLLAGSGRNIVSIEDPVEFPLPFIRQLAVDLRHNLTMTTGLRTVLRMDPDIVFVSEIRDVEAAEIAMRAASSGRFVFSTLHTRDIASTVTALRDLQIDNRSLIGNLTGIISQRLLRKVCPQCCTVSPIADPESAVFLAEGVTPPAALARGSGCPHCRGTGYHDRTGVFEVVSLSGGAVDAIRAGAAESELRSILRSTGTLSLMADALRKVTEGVTTIEEAQAMKWA